MKLLIVDDYPAVRDMLKSMFGFLFEETSEAKDGIEAIRLYKEHKPDWVFMDVKMDRMDGIAATRQIKQYDKNAKVVVVTLFNDKETESDAIEAGAYDVVSKDDLTKIKEIINEVME
jgi:two-component system chemotaxis response regulator CheY